MTVTKTKEATKAHDRLRRSETFSMSKWSIFTNGLISGAAQTPRCHREVEQLGTASGLAQFGAVQARPEDR
jgi:hypothetical protein